MKSYCQDEQAQKPIYFLITLVCEFNLITVVQARNTIIRSLFESLFIMSQLKIFISEKSKRHPCSSDVVPAMQNQTKHDLCQTDIYSSKDKSVMMNLGKYLKCKGTVCFLFRPQYPIFSHLNAFTVLVHLRCQVNLANPSCIICSHFKHRCQIAFRSVRRKVNFEC